MAVKYPQPIYDKVRAGLFYPSAERGMLLVEVLRERRQKVVRIPPFLDKPSAELLSSLMSIGPVLRKPRGRHYVYMGRGGLRMQGLPVFERPRYKWFDPDGEIPSKPSHYPVLGNYAKLMVVCVKGEEVCRYVVAARTMANDKDQLNRQMVKHKDTVTICHVSGDAKYLPTDYEIIKIEPNCWACDGYYLTGKCLYIEPTTHTVTPVKIDTRWGEVRFKVPGKSGIYTIDPEAFPNLRYLGYRSINGLQKKVTGNYIFI